MDVGGVIDTRKYTYIGIRINLEAVKEQKEKVLELFFFKKMFVLNAILLTSPIIHSPQ